MTNHLFPLWSLKRSFAKATNLLIKARYRRYCAFDTETGSCLCLSLPRFWCQASFLSPMTEDVFFSYITVALRYSSLSALSTVSLVDPLYNVLFNKTLSFFFFWFNSSNHTASIFKEGFLQTQSTKYHSKIQSSAFIWLIRAVVVEDSKHLSKKLHKNWRTKRANSSDGTHNLYSKRGRFSFHSFSFLLHVCTYWRD